MDQIILFALLGLAPGALIAALSLSVVLTYRGAGVINLAAGAIAVLGAYAMYGLRSDGSLLLPPLPFAPDGIDFGGPVPTIPAMLIALAACALAGVMMELLVLRPLRRHAPLAKLLATLGVFLIIQAIVVLRFDNDGRSALPILPEGTVSLFDVDVPSNRFMLVGIVIAAAAILTLIYRYSRFGLATRAAAENETQAALMGMSPKRLSMINVVLASTLAGGVGILVAPLAQLDPVAIPAAIVPALAAALLAQFTSFGIAAAAGLGMGVIQSLVTYAQTKPWFPTTGGGAPMPGVSDLIFFLIVVGAMFWRGSGLPERGQLVEHRLPAAPAARRLAAPAALGLAVCIVAFLVLPFDWRQAGMNSLIGVVICLSLVAITGFVGQTSLAQIALAGVSGFLISRLAVDAGIGFPLGPVIGVAGATALGTLIAISALRVRGVNLAIVTLAAAVALENFGFANTTWGGGESGSPVPSPHLLGLNLGNDANLPISYALPSPLYGIVCAVVCVGLCLLVASLRRSDIGHRMLAVRSNERAAAAAGISVARVKLHAFALSAFLAGMAGALYAYNFGSVTGVRFGLNTALMFVAFAYIGGITTVKGAIIGGLLATAGLADHLLIGKLGTPSEYYLLLGGVFLVVTLVLKPEGLASIGWSGSRPALFLKDVLKGRTDGNLASAKARK